MSTVLPSPPDQPFEPVRSRRPRSRAFVRVLVGLAVLGLAYEAILLFTNLLDPLPLRFPVPYAVPIFDTPFALVALGVGYLCLERHRLRQDFQSAALGVTLWLTALLALAHILAQPDYPANPGVNPGIAPYFFFFSYWAGFVGIGLAAHYGDHDARMTDRRRFAVIVGTFVLSVLIVIAVLQIRPLLPSLVMRPGRFTPFAIATFGLGTGLVGSWALWGGRRRFLGPGREDLFSGFLLLAAVVWLIGLVGLLSAPYRYSIPWYLAGLARPIGVGVIFVGLLREQVWLYREARARQGDLEGLHQAGQALVTSLDPRRIAETIAAKAVELAGSDGAILFRLDAGAGVLRAVARAGIVSAELVDGLALPLGQGASGLSVAQRRAVWTSNLHADPRVPFPADVKERMRRNGLRAVLAVPLMMKSGDVFGALSVFHREGRAFADTDVELLAAFGTQASVAIENARAFEELAWKARHDEALQDFCQRLLEATSETAILGEAVRVTRELVQADQVALFLADPKAGCLRMEAGLGWQPGVVGETTVTPSTESFAGYAFLNKESIQAEDLAGERRFSVPSYLAAHGVRAGIVVPVGIREEPTGVVAAYYRAPHRFSDEERRVLTSLAYLTALALEKVHLSAELQANLKTLKETQAQLIQADKLTALGTLLSGMAHELNNPLSTIQLSVQLIKRQHGATLTEPVRKRMEAVEEECERASRIIRDLLVFARRKPPERRRVDLGDVLRAALALQAPQFELNGIRVVAGIEPTPPIWADAHQLQQVFLNLFTNATHAMKSAHGRGTLTVRAAGQPSEVSVVVEDDGPGIPAEHLGRIFDPFFTTKGAGEGTGLGLSLSIGIVEAHGGRMQAENRAEGGARITVQLPTGEGMEAPPAARAIPAPSGRRVRILVVDDEERLRGILTDVLEELGHEVEEASTGQEALERLERGSYDLVALDLRLPDIDGLTVWQRLLARHPRLASAVFFMTGDTMSAETQRFLQEAGRPVLTKPLTIERIRQIVGEMLAAAPPPA